MSQQRKYAVGDTIEGPVRMITPERIEWYDSAMLSAASGELARVGSNIHTDEDYARHEGFPGVIADGMIMANWCSEMMVHHFGINYLERGELRTKFIKPVLLDVTLHVKGRVMAAEPCDGGTRYSLAIWCEDEHGMKLTDGDAKVEVRP